MERLAEIKRGKKASEAEVQIDSNCVRDRQPEEGGWQSDSDVDVSGHFL